MVGNGRGLFSGNIPKFAGATKDYCGSHKPEQPIFGPRFEIGTSRLQSRTVNHSTATSDTG